MTAPLRPRLIPQCTSCIRSNTLTGLEERWGRFGAWSIANNISPGAHKQQVRGAKKKATNAVGALPVRLLKDVPTFGKKGTIVPVSIGQMRNNWFPSRVAAYVTMTERKQLRISNIAIERDFDFGTDLTAPPPPPTAVPYSTPKKPEIKKVTPERSLELLEIFLPHRIDFYRQPIMEEAKQAVAPTEDTSRLTQETRSKDEGSGSDPLATREDAPSSGIAEKVMVSKPKDIYGSVSIHDIVAAMRAAMERNDEAKRVPIHEDDVVFVSDEEGLSTGKVKKLGTFDIEVRVKGSEGIIRRGVRVNAQDM